MGLKPENLFQILGYNPHHLPKNKCNEKHSTYFKVRFLHKLMLYVHSQLNFPRFFDPDQSEYKNKRLPISYNPFVYLKTKIANCGIYSNLFEQLAESSGFEVRHIGLVASDRKNCHWCSEIKVDNKWIFFDTMYLICPVTIGTSKRIFYSAYEIMQNPVDLYFKQIPSIFYGISEQTIVNLWKGLEINKQNSYDLGLGQFIKLFYGVDYVEV